MDGLKRYVNDDRFRMDGDKNMRLLAFAFTIVFVWTGPQIVDRFRKWLYYLVFANEIERTTSMLQNSYYICHCRNNG